MNEYKQLTHTCSTQEWGSKYAKGGGALPQNTSCRGGISSPQARAVEVLDGREGFLAREEQKIPSEVDLPKVLPLAHGKEDEQNCIIEPFRLRISGSLVTAVNIQPRSSFPAVNNKQILNTRFLILN